MGRRSKRSRRAPADKPAVSTQAEASQTSDTLAPPNAAYAPLAEAGLRATTNRVQEMHQAIAAKTFGAWEAVPLLGLTSRIVQGAHDAISDAVYAGVRHGGTALSTLAAGVERMSNEGTPHEPHRVLRNALNAAVGDHLHAASNPLAVAMQLLVDERDVLDNADALRCLGPRVAVFLHGLGCDERSWSRPHAAWESADAAVPAANYAELLQRDEGLSPVFVRYNTGLSIDDNAARFSELLQQLLTAAPQVERVVLIGHSMGGLVARSALELAWRGGAAWPEQTALIVCLGSPHQGAPLEQLGRLTSTALSMSRVTQPLARVAEGRSRGIRDLGDGLKNRPMHAPVPLRLVSGNLADESNGLTAELVGRVLGDGLVPRHSAEDAGLGGDVQRVELPGLGHMALLHHPQVYALLREWVRAALPSD
jgi:pimeloyl-ACP methyl ester carboxylesterase